MTKLTDRKIRWIIREKMKEILSTNDIALLQNVSRSRISQTNGKIERFYETFQSKIEHFNSMEQFVTWYNTKRPHMSLNWDRLETPVQAFYKKIDRRRKQLPVAINKLR